MTIERLNERIKGLVDRFNHEHSTEGLVAEILITDTDVSIHYADKAQRRSEWINEMWNRYMWDAEAEPLLIDQDRGIVVVKHFNHGIGTAVCGKHDKYSEVAGCAIAYARATGREVPDFI